MDHASLAWSLLSHAPDTKAHWFLLHNGRASGGTAGSPEVLDRILQLGRDYSLHLGVQLTHRTQRYRPSARDITHLSTLFVDIDPIGPNPQPLRAAEATLAHAEHLLNTRLDPHLIDSGRGAQLWFPFPATPLPSAHSRGRWQRDASLFLRALAARSAQHFDCRVDTSTADLPRVGRLPGSFNQKSGRRAELLTLGRLAETLPAALHTWAESQDPHEHQSPCAAARDPDRWQPAIDLIPHATARIFLTEGVPEPGRHSAAFHTAAALCEVGVSLSATLRAVCFGALLCQPRLRRDDALHAAHNGWNHGRAKDGHQGRELAAR